MEPISSGCLRGGKMWSFIELFVYRWSKKVPFGKVQHSKYSRVFEKRKSNPNLHENWWRFFFLHSNTFKSVVWFFIKFSTKQWKTSLANVYSCYSYTNNQTKSNVTRLFNDLKDFSSKLVCFRRKFYIV